MANRLIIPMLISVMTVTLAVMASCGRDRQQGGTDGSLQEMSADTIRRASIVFGGDVMAHMPQVMAARRDSAYDFSETFKFIKPFFDTANVVILNLETTISETGEYSGYPKFASPPALIDALKESGVNILALANNHICDKGANGIRSTTAIIEKTGLRYTGAYADSSAYKRLNPLYFNVNRIRFALLNYTYGTNGIPIPEGMVVNTIDTVRIAADLTAALKDSAEITIVFFHWGVEYTHTPTPPDIALAQWCRDRGADIVIGSHPHVLQRPEASLDTSGIARSVTVYSMGNLVSNQRERYTDGGMLVRLDIVLSDSLPPAIEAQYMFTWTYAHWKDGQKYYHILPSPIADTLLKAGFGPRLSYNRFMADSRALFDTIPGFKEIRSAYTVPLSAQADTLPTEPPTMQEGGQSRGDTIPGSIATPIQRDDNTPDTLQIEQLKKHTAEQADTVLTTASSKQANVTPKADTIPVAPPSQRDGSQQALSPTDTLSPKK